MRKQVKSRSPLSRKQLKPEKLSRKSQSTLKTWPSKSHPMFTVESSWERRRLPSSLLMPRTKSWRFQSISTTPPPRNSQKEFKPQRKLQSIFTTPPPRNSQKDIKPLRRQSKMYHTSSQKRQLMPPKQSKKAPRKPTSQLRE